MNHGLRRHRWLLLTCTASLFGAGAVGCAAKEAGTASPSSDLAADIAGPLDTADAASDAPLEVDAPGADALDTAADATADQDSAPETSAASDSAADAQSETADATDLADAATAPVQPAASGGDFFVDLGGSSDDGTAIAPWDLPGTAAKLIYGPQGGYHVWVSICTPASLGTKVQLRLVLTAANGEQVHPGPTEITSKMAVVPGKDGQLCRVAAPAFVTCACELAGKAVRVRAEVTEAAAVSPGPSPPPLLAGWAEKTAVLTHDLGPCWAEGQAPCAALRAKK
jgi:hypothetical protein